jgi:hypothetical protein
VGLNHDCYTFTGAESVHENVVSALASRQSLRETLDALCNTTDSLCNAEKDGQVCQFLETLFSAVFPGCKVIPFGSRVSGLALSGSDLDVFLDTGNSSVGGCWMMDVGNPWLLVFIPT